MISTYEKENKEYDNNIYLLKQSNTDLTHQLQHLLKKYYDIQQQQQQQSGSGMLSPSFNRSAGARSSTGGGVAGGAARLPAIVETGDEYGNVPMAISASAEGSGGATSADDVISNFLVTFDSIEELQTRNQQLLQVVRKLTSEQVSVGWLVYLCCVY